MIPQTTPTLSNLTVSSQPWIPSDPACRRTRARLQAWMAIRLSTRTGNQLRAMVGPTGDITSLSPDVVRSKFDTPMEQGAALYNLALADFVKSKRKNTHGEIA
jgi:hypothetical protein